MNPYLTTERLVLRKPRIEDAGPLFDSYASDPEVVKYLTWQAYTRVEDYAVFLSSSIGKWRNNSDYIYVISEDENDPPFGMIGFHKKTDNRAEIGYVISRSNWGKGYMTEALKAIIDEGFRLDQMVRIGALCDVENTASARVMEKAGMLYEGKLLRYAVLPNRSPEPRDMFSYAKVVG